MVYLAEEIVQAARIAPVDDHLLGVLVETALGLHGLGKLAPKKGPAAVSADLRNPKNKRAIQPWNNEDDFSSDGLDSELEDITMDDY